MELRTVWTTIYNLEIWELEVSLFPGIISVILSGSFVFVGTAAFAHLVEQLIESEIIL